MSHCFDYVYLIFYIHFLDIKVLICDFRRDPAWLRQLKHKEMNLDEHKHEIQMMLAFLRHIARVRFDNFHFFNRCG